MSAPTLRETLHDLGFRILMAVIGVGSLVVIYRIKHTTPYLGFVPQNPVLLVIGFGMLLSAVGLGWLLYREV